MSFGENDHVIYGDIDYATDVPPGVRMNESMKEFILKKTSANPDARETIRFPVTVSSNCLKIDITDVPETLLTEFLALVAYVAYLRKIIPSESFICIIEPTGKTNKKTTSVSVAFDDFYCVGMTVGSQFLSLQTLKRTIFNPIYLNGLFAVIYANKHALQAEEQATDVSNTADTIANGRVST